MHDWKRLLIRPDEKIIRAIELLNDEAQRIVLVTDGDKKLLGTVTDGDIRRGLIQKINMDAPVSDIMFRTPRTAFVDDDPDIIFDIMKKHNLYQVPVLDKNGVVVDLKLLQSFIKKTHHDNAVFLMAGGFGKRLRPLTNDIPKPLLKVGNKPILQTILESFIKSGFSRFYISTHYKAEMVCKYFGNGDQWDVSIEYVNEEHPLGTAGALGLLPKKAICEPILMMNGDLLTKINYENLLQYHDESGGVATMCVREYDFQVPYGVVTTQNSKIKQIIEKPVHKFFINAGIYVLSPELIQNFEANCYKDMPDFLQEQIGAGKDVNVFPIHESWLDIGCLDDFERAQGRILK